MTEPLSFEERARQAAAGLNHAVQQADLQLYAAGIPALREQPASRWRVNGSERWVAMAGAFAAILIVVGIAVLPGTLFAPDTEVGTSQTLPDGAIVPIDTVPNDDAPATSESQAVEESTTSTEASADSSTTIAVDSVPPELMISTPVDGVTVSESLMQFVGTTEPGATVIAAGQWDVKVDDEGNWEIILGLNSGSNIVTFTAIDAAGNETDAQLTVTYDPPSPTTTTTIPDSEPGAGEGEGTDDVAVEFLANAQFEVCEENPPFNVYRGTALAGTKVSIISDYGEGHVYADETGNWEIRVEYPEAPYNVQFLVTVRNVESGATKNFEFTSLADG